MRNAMWPVYARAIQSAVGSCLDETEAETLSALLARIIDAAASVEPNSLNGHSPMRRISESRTRN